VSQESKGFGFAVFMVAVVLAVVILIWKGMQPVLKGSGDADMSPEAVAERIAPVGQLKQKDAPATAEMAAAPEEAAAESADTAAEAAEPAETTEVAEAEAPAEEESSGRSGESVYNAKCLACHLTGASGAPKLGDTAAWKDRIAKGKEALYNSALNGVPGTAMLPKGTCNDCTEQELKATVDYMVSQSQ